LTDHEELRHIEITDGERTVATADVVAADESAATVRASLHTESGPIPPGTQASLVDAVLDLSEVKQSERVQVAVPRGDVESLLRLQQRCAEVATRTAGVTAFVEAEPPESARREQAGNSAE